ncbi:GuaB1 family IMP dehydrogenase-related protein [Candidatus Gracilibacteria bacterium]|nr:GuaB1 family IMP dehydrogenase-related protein [Candidatus Gracilibacteria bacterium]
MKFNNPIYENEELVYEDVFLFQNYFDGKSRLDADVKPVVNLGTNIPIITANMNAVSGKRMAETIARYGGLSVLPQDMDIETLTRIIKHIKNADTQYDTPITVKAQNTIRDALGIIHKRAHNCVILIDDENKAISIFKPQDLENLDQFTLLGNINRPKLITGKIGISDEDAFILMDEKGISSLPVVDDQGKLRGILTKKNTLRNNLYKPTLDENGNLDVAVAVGINNFDEKVQILFDLGIRIFVLDTAHGYQKSMIENIKKIRSMYGDKIKVIAGNVITEDATRELILAGADGVKVGIGPGAMCTTRMKTGVGRPQFTAVYKCVQEAKKHGGFVWADGGIKTPRDFILALAAGASHVMRGTRWAGTFESVGDVKYDEEGKMYKENYGMASKKAVGNRSQNLNKFQQAQKQMFREGISTSRIYIKSGMESVGDIVDECMTGLRSSMTYLGAKNLAEFSEKAIVGVQTSAGFVEGTPHGKIKK